MQHCRYKMFDSLQLYEIEDARDDIKTNLEFDKDNTEFWNCMMAVCDDECSKLKEGGGEAGGTHGGRELHSSIDNDIQKVLKGKTAGELSTMESNIEAKIESGDAVDIEYWETLLRKLRVQKARAKLREFHEQLLTSHLNALEDAERLDAFGRDRELR